MSSRQVFNVVMGIDKRKSCAHEGADYHTIMSSLVKLSTSLNSSGFPDFL